MINDDNVYTNTQFNVIDWNNIIRRIKKEIPPVMRLHDDQFARSLFDTPMFIYGISRICLTSKP